MTRKENKALIATGRIDVQIDGRYLSTVECTKLVQKFKIFSELPDVVSTLTVINQKEKEDGE